MAENKPVLLKELTETGFYCAIDDNERYHIFEVLNNTDEEWLKENPEQTLLIDEWIYDYTDYDDRKVYGTSGNLVATCNDISTCKVHKVEDTKYKIFGSVGQFLIEDKPTYKEQLALKEQECERLKDELSTYGATGICETCTAKSVLQNDKYTKALREIKDIAEQQVPYINLDQVKTCTEVEYDYVGKIWNLEQRMYNILQKIAECEVLNDR